MRPQRKLLLFLVLSLAFLLAGCTGEDIELKQKVAELEKKLQKQEKDLHDFAGKIAPPKDFSADIQRIEDQQDKISVILKTKVDPVNNKLEEFRDWAQDAQKERETVAKKLKGLEQSVAEVQKRWDATNRELVNLNKDWAAQKKTTAAQAKSVEDVSKALADVRKDMLDNNAKLLTAVKKVLPKVKDAAVAELNDRILPLEQRLVSLTAGAEGERKTIETPKPPQRPLPPGETPKDIQTLMSRIKELEDVVVAQKGYLLEVGSKVHELETQLRRSTGSSAAPQAGVSQR